MNGAYAATTIALIAALAKRGMVSGSMSKNPHTNRVKVNFNLNRSTFTSKVSDQDKYFQYSLYGNTSNIEIYRYSLSLLKIDQMIKVLF